jgi:hypothetical protein
MHIKSDHEYLFHLHCAKLFVLFIIPINAVFEL